LVWPLNRLRISFSKLHILKETHLLYTRLNSSLLFGTGISALESGYIRRKKKVFTFNGKRKLGGNVVKSVKVGGSDLFCGGCASPMFFEFKNHRKCHIKHYRYK
jgi:hypothetical protein